MPAASLTSNGIATPEKLFSHIATVKAIINDYQLELDALMKLVATMEALGDLDDYKTDKGYVIDHVRITPCSKDTWTYSEALKREIKDLQKDAQVNGRASKTTSSYYRVTAL